MNVLLTSAGRRNYLVKYFKAAVGAEGCVIAADASSTAPALSAADRSYVIPPFDAPNYLGEIVGLCERERIGLVVPLNDFELEVLAHHRGTLERIGAVPVVSPVQVIRACLDKHSTIKLLDSVGLSSPRTFLNLGEALRLLESGEIRYPVVVKPRWGSGSAGTFFPENVSELRAAFELAGAVARRGTMSRYANFANDEVVLIQERVEGTEFGLDVINDLRGRHAATMMRRKLSMRSGETERAEIVERTDLAEVGKRLAMIGHVGCLDADVIIGQHGPIAIDLNPRFGGGYPFSHLAGANLPAALIAWAQHRPADHEWLRPRVGVTSAKFDDLTSIGTNV